MKDHLRIPATAVGIQYRQKMLQARFCGNCARRGSKYCPKQVGWVGRPTVKIDDEACNKFRLAGKRKARVAELDVDLMQLKLEGS